ncbi:MAG: hypothetical protein ACRENE_21275, partial [Polyangiaceae bacterium]
MTPMASALASAGIRDDRVRPLVVSARKPKYVCEPSWKNALDSRRMGREWHRTLTAAHFFF